MKNIRSALVAAGLVIGSIAVALAGSSTLTVIDGNQIKQNLGVTTDGSGNFYSNTALVDGSNAANKATVTAGNALKVDGSAVTQPVSGTVTANAGTGTMNVNCTSGCSGTNGSVSSTGTAVPGSATYLGANNGGNLTGLTSTANGLKVDGSAVTQPVSGTVAATESGIWTVQPGNTANTTPWLATINQGGNSASVTASNALKVDGSAVTQPVSGTVTANQGGTWTVQPGNTANTTAWLVTTTPATGNGWTPFLANALSTTVVTVKASAGELGSYYCWNPNASVEYVQIFDASSVTLGTTTPKWSIGIPPTSAANLEMAQGMHFGTAIKVAATTTATGLTAPGTALDCNFAYN